ncbi:MAG: ComEC/Rec2 family competence protein [Anaerolineales bacterium]
MRFRWLLFLLPILLGATPTQSAPIPAEISIAFIDVGQGDATLIRDGTGFDILVDGGRKSVGDEVIDYLQQAGIDDLEIMIATHADSDHIGGLIAILESEEIQVESVYFNGYPGDTLTWLEFTEAVNADGLSLQRIEYPQTLNLGGLEIRVLNPLPGMVEPEQNEASVVLIFTYAQITLLLTADIETGVEELILERSTNLHADILKVAHHGSKHSSSTAFLAEIQPQEAIISVGVNPYGHPAPETLARLSDIGANIMRTDMVGTVLVTSDGIDYRIIPILTYLPLIFQVIINP